MSALLLLPGLSRPTSIQQASRSLEIAWQNLCAAQQAWCDVKVGNTEELFAVRDSWVDAMHGYERARLELAKVVKRSHVPTVLRLVVSNG